jgi:hypothetical protein
VVVDGDRPGSRTRFQHEILCRKRTVYLEYRVITELEFGIVECVEIVLQLYMSHTLRSSCSRLVRAELRKVGELVSEESWLRSHRNDDGLNRRIDFSANRSNGFMSTTSAYASRLSSVGHVDSPRGGLLLRRGYSLTVIAVNRYGRWTQQTPCERTSR